MNALELVDFLSFTELKRFQSLGFWNVTWRVRGFKTCVLNLPRSRLGLRAKAKRSWDPDGPLTTIILNLGDPQAGTPTS